jgi:membrane associated rhomboid family serine protease/antitoxin component YwqK of YwqJK toxin-antitoxin module
MEKYKATIILVAVNVLVFIWQVIQTDSIMMDDQSSQYVILQMGANLNPLTLGGESWRLFTSMFLHGGFIHLILNMYGLAAIGWSLEEGIGSPRFVLVYFVCGVVAGLISLSFNVFVFSVGASGAVFGIFAYALTAEIIAIGNDREKLMPIVANFAIFLIANLLITRMFSVDLAGHLGGMVAGVILAVLHFKLRVLSSILALLILLIVIPFTMAVLPKDQVQYSKLFNELVQIERDENRYLSTYRSDNALADSLLLIKDRWDSLSRRTQSFAFVNKEIAVDTLSFKQVLEVHRNQTYYRSKVLDQSYIYMDSMEYANAQFDSIAPFHFYPRYDTPPQEEQQPEPELPRPPRYYQARVFYDSLWKETDDPINHVYYRIGMRDSIGRWQGKARDYYRSGKLQMKGEYVDNLRNGIFIYYSEHNTYQSAGRYQKEIAVGKWEEFHWNGTLAEEVFYDGRGFTKSVWDSLGRPQVVNGIGKKISWHANGLVAEEGNYINGKRDGMWKGFHDDGSPYYEEMYRENDLIRGVAITKDGRHFVYDESSQYPTPEGGMQAFRKYEIYNKNKEFTWSGSVRVVFDVASDGSMSDFTILDSSCQECNAEAIRLVKEGPRWRPGVLHGHKKVSGRGYVDISF